MPITNRKIQSDFHFKTLEDGTKIFYPQGLLGRRGYYISSPELEPRLRQDIRRFQKRQMMLSTILVTVAGPLVMIPWAFSHIANSPIAQWSKWGETAYTSSLLGYMLLFLVLLVSSIWLYPITNNPTMFVCSAVFTLMLVPGSIAIYTKFYKKRTH